MNIGAILATKESFVSLFVGGANHNIKHVKLCRPAVKYSGYDLFSLTDFFLFVLSVDYLFLTAVQ